MTGRKILDLAKVLYPINRSITGQGVRDSLNEIRKVIPGLEIVSVPSGTKCFDWTVPPEWEVSEAYLLGPDGAEILNLRNHNLHVVGYSEPIDINIDLADLQNHLHSLPNQPDAIPYITSYYEPRWGFCLTESKRRSLRPGTYRAVIRSRKFNGVLNYGELFIKGESESEVFLSSYVCHPQMANNEVSGPSVLSYVGQWLESLKNRLSYRLVFVPETIGAICYLSNNLAEMKDRVIAGFNLTCIGDNRTFSMIDSRTGNTLADRVARRVLHEISNGSFSRYSYLERGSDERQYGSPLVNLPLVTLCRTKFYEFPEYHTSKDDFSVVTAEGLNGGFEMVRRCIAQLELGKRFIARFPCEPQLGSRHLYPSLGGKRTGFTTELLLNILAYSDGTYDLRDIADICSVELREVETAAEQLLLAGLIDEAL